MVRRDAERHKDSAFSGSEYEKKEYFCIHQDFDPHAVREFYHACLSEHTLPTLFSVSVSTSSRFPILLLLFAQSQINLKMTVTWNKSRHTSFLLWDIDREFQNAYELYEQLPAKHGDKRSTWARLAVKSQDDKLAKALNLGREIRSLMETGIKRFGARFEEGDCVWINLGSAQIY